MPRTKAPATLKDVDQVVFIHKLAQHFKTQGKVEVPKTIDFLKTAPSKEASPEDPDWWYLRVASIARRLYLNPKRGVHRLRWDYGSKARRGSRPNIFELASPGPIRNAIQQLEKLGLAEAHPAGGKQLSAAGRRELDQVARQIILEHLH
eukprot:TRINITY_DN644_c0_g1_i1.p2 TRINITY_DN644_c0_g1~~TRINITY_DN644_c0_g1_i1.p2  ORF type:complete len:149 (-),score=21.45 TRINITY_DN644_c0_g1_i1:51-497(-)